jgi:hypothetical protein
VAYSGGYIVTRPSRAQTSYVDRRSWSSALEGELVKGPSTAQTAYVDPRSWAAALDGLSRIPGLGQETTSPRDAALAAYKAVAAETLSISEYVRAARPADWNERIIKASERMIESSKQFREKVIGKTGDRDAEIKLLQARGEINAQLTAMVQNQPSIARQIVDVGLQVVEPYFTSIKVAADSLLSWAEARAMDVLKQFHGARIRIVELKRDLARAAKEGVPEVTRIAQAAKIAAAERALDKVSLADVRALGIPALDDLVQKLFGKYPTISGGPLAALLAPAGILALAAAVGILIVAISLANAIGFISTAAPGTFGLGLVALGALAIYLLTKGGGK